MRIIERRGELLLKDLEVLLKVVESDLQIEQTKIIISKYRRKMY